MFGLSKNPPYTELDRLYAQEGAKEQREIARRQWAVEQAVFIDDASAENVIRLAEKLYRYAFGEPHENP